MKHRHQKKRLHLPKNLGTGIPTPAMPLLMGKQPFTPLALKSAERQIAPLIPQKKMRPAAAVMLIALRAAELSNAQSSFTDPEMLYLTNEALACLQNGTWTLDASFPYSKPHILADVTEPKEAN